MITTPSSELPGDELRRLADQAVGGDLTASFFSFSDVARTLRSAVDALAVADKALEAGAADFRSSPGTVMSTAAEAMQEFQRRQALAGAALAQIRAVMKGEKVDGS